MSTSVDVTVEAVENFKEVAIVDEKPVGSKKNTTATVSKKRRRRVRKYPRLAYEERCRNLEREQLSKKVLEVGLKGRVKWYSVLERYGFIERNDGKQDVFVHQSAIAKSFMKKFYLRTLAGNEPVEFDLVQGRQGPEAANVTGPNGENVKGSKNYKALLRGYRENYGYFRRKKRDQRKNNAKNNEHKTTTDANEKNAQHRRGHHGSRTPEPVTDEVIVDVVLRKPETPENVVSTIVVDPTPKRRNYYSRRFRCEKTEPKHEDGANHKKMNPSTSSGMAAESENGRERDQNAGICLRSKGGKLKM